MANPAEDPRSNILHFPPVAASEVPIDGVSSGTSHHDGLRPGFDYKVMGIAADVGEYLAPDLARVRNEDHVVYRGVMYNGRVIISSQVRHHIYLYAQLKGIDITQRDRESETAAVPFTIRRWYKEKKPVIQLPIAIHKDEPVLREFLSNSFPPNSFDFRRDPRTGI